MSHPRPSPSGLVLGLIAYGMWGFFPLFFHQLAHLPPVDVLCNRALWGWVFVALLLTGGRQWHKTIAVLRSPRQVAMLVLAAVLISVNWLVFLWAVGQGQVMASSLGYFLTPLINVLLGLAVLKERLDRLEWVAIALALLAVGNELLTLGSVPWISLVLAGTFGLYGLVRKRLPVDAMSGLWLETSAMLPVCAAYALWAGQHHHAVFTGHTHGTALLLLGAGVLTALPLMAFAGAARRLDLATVGMLMYINPTLQFLTAVWCFAEPLSSGRMTTFILIWSGLAVFSWSLWRKLRRPPGTEPPP